MQPFPLLNDASDKKVQVGKDQEKAQSEKDSHSKNLIAIDLVILEIFKIETVNARTDARTTTRLPYEPVHKKTNNLGVRPDPTQTGLYSDSIKLEA